MAETSKPPPFSRLLTTLPISMSAAPSKLPKLLTTSGQWYIYCYFLSFFNAHSSVAVQETLSHHSCDPVCVQLGLGWQNWCQHHCQYRIILGWLCQEASKGKTIQKQWMDAFQQGHPDHASYPCWCPHLSSNCQSLDPRWCQWPSILSWSYSPSSFIRPTRWRGSRPWWSK